MQCLSSEDDEERDEEGDVLPVEDLDGGDDVDSVDAAGAGIGEDGDENVLLHVEGAGIEGEFIAGVLEKGPRRQSGGHETAERHDSDLGGDGADRERLLAVPEELVQKGEDETGEDAQNPHPEGQHGYIWVIRYRHGQRHLLYRRVLDFLLVVS